MHFGYMAGCIWHRNFVGASSMLLMSMSARQMETHFAGFSLLPRSLHSEFTSHSVFWRSHLDEFIMMSYHWHKLFVPGQ